MTPSMHLERSPFDLARAGRTQELARQLDAGLSPDAADPKGDGLLMLAAYHGHAATVRLLLARGADPEARGGRGLSPLDGAAFKGDLEVMAALVDGGAAVDGALAGGRTPLHWAAAFDRAEAVTWLLGQGAGLRRRDDDGLDARALASAMGAARSLAALGVA